MDSAKLAAIMAELNFPAGQYAIFGGACLAAHGIRLAPDLEIFVSPELYGHLQADGWEARTTGSTGAAYLTKTVQGIPVLAFITCGSERWVPDVQAYLEHPEMVNKLPFMPLSEMYAWKAATARPKDLADVQLIDTYWQSQVSRS